MRRYKGIDAGRLMFACFIPLLHIPLPHIFGVEVIQQYIARLGVPHFYAVSGMFLSKSLPERPQLKYADAMLQRSRGYCVYGWRYTRLSCCYVLNFLCGRCCS